MFGLDEDYRRIDEIINKHPQLTNEETIALARSARAGDAQARELMILHNLRLVVAIVKPFTNKATFADACQEGIEGLIKAVDKFDPERGTAFSTYAIWWVKQALRLWIFQRNTLYVSRHMHDAIIRVKKVTESGERNPAIIADLAKLPVNHVMMAQAVLSTHYVSLDMPMDSMDGETTMADFLLDDHDPYADIDESDVRSQLAHQILEMLPSRDQQIMRMYFGFEDGKEMSFTKIGPHLGISPERVRQLYSRAMRQLKQMPMEEASA